nr:hypothetical protein [Tanacetum cinerariifolium]
ASELGPPAILATIDKTPYTVTEDLVRSQLQLADDDGIADLPIAKIYSAMDNLCTKSDSWDQFGSPLAVALICLSDGRRFNWSSYIFKGMVSNIGNPKKFLMYPRFLQTILGIETRVTRQYKVLVFSSKLFANMRLNFEGHPMLLLPAILLQAQAGEGAKVATQAIPQPVPAPDQPPASLSTPSRQQTSDPIAPVLKHGQSSDPHTTSFSRSHETNAGLFTTLEDAPIGGDFHTSPLRSSQVPPAGQPSGGAKDPITLTALSYVVSTLAQTVHSLESELKDHKKLFKDVVGKLVKKDGGTQVMDLDALRALANAVVHVDSNIPSGGTLHIPVASLSVTSDVPPGTFDVPLGTSAVPSSASTAPAGSPHIPTNVPSSAALAGVSSKGKSPMVEEDIPIKARTFKQMEEDILGEEAGLRLKLMPLSSRLYWIRKVQSNSQIQAFSRTLKRPDLVLEEPSSKRQQSTEAPSPSVPEVSRLPAVSSPLSSRTRRKYVVPTSRLIVPTGRYVVPTGRVKVATGRYVVPTGRLIVPTGRYVVPTGRVKVATGRYVVPVGNVL